MPRVKPTKAAPVFHARGHSLSDGAKDKLTELLGFGKVDFLAESIRRQMPGMRLLRSEPGEPLLLEPDPDFKSGTSVDVGKIILDVQDALGLYIHGQTHLDNVPRSAHYVAAFKPVHKDALALLTLLNGWTEYYRDQFALNGVDIYAIETALGSLMVVASKVVKENQGRSSKGAKRNTALTEVIRRLRRIFRAAYRGKVTGRNRQGAFQFKAAEEKSELEFVEMALLDAKIIPASYAELPRLFRDPRCMVLEEPASAVGRIASKVEAQPERRQKRNK